MDDRSHRRKLPAVRISTGREEAAVRQERTTEAYPKIRQRRRVRGHEDRVAGEQRDRDAQLGVGRALADLGDDPPDRDSFRHAAGGSKNELQAGGWRSLRGCRPFSWATVIAGAGHSPGGKSVEAASSVCASKLAIRLRSEKEMGELTVLDNPVL